MAKLILRRAAVLPVLLLAVLIISFGLLYLVPGDPAVTLAGDEATPEQVAAIRTELGLDDPMLARFGTYVSDVATGDLGRSLFTGAPVIDLITDRVPVTASLAALSLVFALLISIPASLLAAGRPGGVADRVVTAGSTMALSVPSFWLALILLSWFSVSLGWFPAVGYVPLTEDPVGWLKHMTLPALALGVGAAAEITRQLQAALGDVLGQQYVVTLKASGIASRRILSLHGLKNAGIPAVTVTGFQVAQLLGGSVVVEQVFGLAGLGSLASNAVLSRDMPVVQGVVLVSALAVLVINVVIDMSYAYFNPKLRSA